MKSDIFPITVCAWCGTVLGLAVCVSSFGTAAFAGSVICTVLAAVIAVASTLEITKP